MKKYKDYTAFADVFRYPQEDFPEVVKKTLDLLTTRDPLAASEMQIFYDHIAHCTADEREELFTKTFDVQPICYLDLGYVIFGEDYKRGAFLLHMQGEQQKIGNDCGSDLPDNLCNMLTLFSNSEDQVLLDGLAVNIMIPGLKKMLAEFESARVELKLKVLKKLHSALIDEDLNKGNVYRNALNALLLVFQNDFAGVDSIRQEAETEMGVASRLSFLTKRSDIELENNFKLD